MTSKTYIHVRFSLKQKPKNNKMKLETQFYKICKFNIILIHFLKHANSKNHMHNTIAKFYRTAKTP